jgi:hypothetical protein
MAGLVPAISRLNGVSPSMVGITGTRPVMTADVAYMATTLAPPRDRE